jgi:hypothetical protein
MCLPLASKALAPLLWLLASEAKDGTFDGSVDELVFRLHITPKEYEDGIKPLIHNGFFIIASGVLAPSLQVAIPEREGETERETETETKKEKKSAVAPRPEDVSQQVWDDWVALRKRKGTTVSETAIDAARKDAAKIGWTLEQFFIEWCVRGSQGLKASWIKSDQQNSDKAGQISPTGQMNKKVISGLTRGLLGGDNNVQLLGN